MLWSLCFAAVCALPKVGGCSQADFQAIHCKPDSKTRRGDTTSECLDASSCNSILSGFMKEEQEAKDIRGDVLVVRPTPNKSIQESLVMISSETNETVPLDTMATTTAREWLDLEDAEEDGGEKRKSRGGGQSCAFQWAAVVRGQELFEREGSNVQARLKWQHRMQHRQE